MSKPSDSAGRIKKQRMIFTPMTPESTFQYADINIKHVDPETNVNPVNSKRVSEKFRTTAIVKRAIRMGYDAVAINLDIGDISEYYTEADMLWTPGQKSLDSVEEPPKKKKKKGALVAENGLAGVLRKKLLPLPFYVNTEDLDTDELEKRGKVFRQFSRITFTANEQIVLNKSFIHPTILAFDLVAVRPGDPSVLDTLSRKTELFDIITTDRLSSDKAKWLSMSKVLERMRGDGIYYEISYSECLTSATRKTSLFNGRVLLRSLKSKNIIISSGAEEMLDLRAPVDVMNMSILWGIANNEVRKMVSGSPKNMLLQAECRGTENGDLQSMKLVDAENMVDGALIPDNTSAPPVEVRINNSQYEALLKATKNAAEKVRKTKLETKL